ncbi:MAG TPA: hypothetical protein VGB53_17285 [Rubricoccaceae bacterium]|jgi:DNA-binding beta-propeller fold protein YncE
MTLRLAFALWSGLALAACAAPPIAPGLPVAAALTETREAARFVDARAVASDASGRLYVADAGRAQVVVFAPAGTVAAVLGGPGTADEALAEPVDVDPTNGQAVYVADAATGRVVRFTAERRAAEAIPIPDTAGDALDARTVGAAGDAPRGRPVGVAAGAGADLVVAEARRSVVLVLDAARRVQRTVGPFRALAGLASDARGRLFVLDGGTVRTFDPFGASGPDLDTRAVGPVRGVSVADEFVLAAGDTGVAVFRVRTGEALAVVPSSVPLVDATAAGGVVWGLTRTGLVALGPAPVL